MRTAIISDIHGNVTALDAVLADLRLTSPDVILHGGDLAASGAHPAEIVDRIRDLGWPGVQGNTDEMLWNRKSLTNYAKEFPKLKRILGVLDEMIPWTQASLGEDRMRWLEALPRSHRQGSIAVVHASPNDLWKAPLPNASDVELQNVYRELEAPIAVYGHIHQPFVRNFAGQRIANTGSVSLSYDGDPRASYLLVDNAVVSIRRVKYDLEREADALLRSGVPHAGWLAQILRAGCYQQPP